MATPQVFSLEPPQQVEGTGSTECTEQAFSQMHGIPMSGVLLSPGMFMGRGSDVACRIQPGPRVHWEHGDQMIPA